MERRIPRRSSILRPTSQFEADPLDPSGETVTLAREPTDGPMESHTFTTMTFTRRSMKRVSFANKIEEVRFYEKDIHAHADETPTVAPNRVMPAEGTDAHHSLLHDPVKIGSGSENAFSPGRMDLTDVQSVSCDDENNDPQFYPDGVDHEESVFEKSVFMDIVEDASQDFEGASTSSLGNAPRNPMLVNYPDDDEEDPPLADVTPPRRTLDQMRLEDMEASCLFLHTPTSNKAGRTACVSNTARPRSSSYEDSLILPDASGTDVHVEENVYMEVTEECYQVSRIRSGFAGDADPVTQRMPLFDVTSRTTTDESASISIQKRNASPVDMDISAALPSEISCIEPSVVASTPGSDTKGFLTSTMVWSGQKNQSARAQAADEDEDSSSAMSLPKKPRTEVVAFASTSSWESNSALPIISRPQKRLNVHRFADSEKNACFRLRPDEVVVPSARIDVNLALPRLKFPEPVECGVSRFPILGLRKATEQLPDWKHSRGPWLKEGERELIQQLDGFKKNFLQQKERVKPASRAKTRVSLGRKIDGGHVERCWWVQKLGLSNEGPHVNWGSYKHLLRLTNCSLRRLEDFLVGSVAKLEYLDISLPEQCGLFRVRVDSPRLSGTAKDKDRILNWAITEFELLPRKPLKVNKDDVNYCNRLALGEAVLESVWKFFLPQFEAKYQSTEQWKDLWKSVATWVGMARQFFTDIDACYSLLPTARIHFPGGTKIHLDVPAGLNVSVSAEISLKLESLPYPDCPVVINNVSCASLPLQRAVSKRVADEMAKAFSDKRGIYGMGLVLAQQAARIASGTRQALPPFLR